MDQPALAGSGSTKKPGPFRMGLKGLMVAVACCALCIWAGLTIRDQVQGYQPLRTIRSGNSVERRDAAQDVLHDRALDPDAAMAGLIGALADTDAEVRAVAAQCLGSLVCELREPPPSGKAAEDLLKRRIAVATRNLVSSLSDRDPGVRAAAATGLGTLAHGPRPAPDLPDRLAVALSGRNPRNPVYATGVPRAPKQLAALWDASNSVRRQAAKQLYGSPDTALLPELVRALHDGSAEVRAAAARALARFGTDLDPRIPILVAMMEHDEPKVHEACALALWAAWPTPALVPTLVGSLKSRDPDVRFHAAQLLGRIGPKASAAIPALVAVLNGPLEPPYPNWDPGRAAARALGMMGPDPQAIAALVQVISPEKVARIMAMFPKPEAPSTAKRGQRHVASPPPDARWFGAVWNAKRIMAAIDALGDIGPPAIAAVPALIAAYRKALEVRHTMAEEAIPRALGRIAPNSTMARDVVAVLIHVLDSKDDFYHRGAVEALGEFGREATVAIPKLRTLKEGRTFNSEAAAKSLAAIEAESTVFPSSISSPGASAR